MSNTTATPSPEEVDDFLLSCRYGELEEVTAFVEKFGAEAVVNARDDRGNTAVHMCSGNGHVGKLLSSAESSRESNQKLMFRCIAIPAAQLAGFTIDDEK